MDKSNCGKMQSGSMGKCSPPPANSAAKAGTAAIRPSQPSGNTGSQGPTVRKSGNQG